MPQLAIDVDALIRLQWDSYDRAGQGLRSSWPPESAMHGTMLRDFLEQHTFCVLATTTPTGRAQARPVAYTVLGTSFWFATVAGARLRNVRQTPWVSVVITEGDRDEHRAVLLDGPVTISAQASEELFSAWRTRHGNAAEWASTWLELVPAQLLSYAG
jgi:nitroimidazol reductase NimA-like FMN-containing flavoprotein (pyridoxamine 5'-phosphate oxidase superfamily)